VASTPGPRPPTREQGYAVGFPTTGTGYWGINSVDNIEKTPELQWPLSLDVYDAMRRGDAQIKSALRAVTHPILRTGWWIDRNGASDEVVALVAEDMGLPVRGEDQVEPPLRTRDRFSWHQHIHEALLMLVYGHAFFEQVLRLDDQGRARLRKLAFRPPRTISRINVNDDGGLLSVQQYAPVQGAVNDLGQSPVMGDGGMVTLPVSRLVCYINEREGGNWLGVSMLRPAYKNWVIKDRLLRVQGQMVERNGMGVPLYTAADKELDLTSGKAIANAWRSGDNAGAAIPFGAKLALVGVTGTLPNIDPVIRYHDEQIARSVLAHFLNLGTQTGSWALGSTFADFFTLSLQTLAQQIADTATQHVVEDLVDYNFGLTERAPRVVFDEIGSRHDADAIAIKQLLQSGAIRSDVPLEAWLRNSYGLPVKDPDEPEPVPVAPPEDPGLAKPVKSVPPSPSAPVPPPDADPNA